MNFVSFAFVGLFAVVFAARLTIGRRKTEMAYLAVLLLASAVFYGWHVPGYLAILVGTALADYGISLAMARLSLDDRRRKVWLAASVLSNLGLLGFFKYGNFAEQLAEEAAALVGVSLRLDALNVVLPMGISFYTFQTLSYTIDVYRGTLVPVRSFWRFLLFVTFFPQLVAGPIVRASEFLPQLSRPRRLRLRVFYEGVWLIINGAFFKMVCADNLASYVDEYWVRGARPGSDATFALWLALMFSGQIFADFYGYSTIARGLGYLLGFRFPDNFNAPYIAGTFKDFWQRWHMTLSRWLRDYLYVPLGGNRTSRLRTYVNLILVMLLGGLWHGAAYTFVAWGAIHGVCLAIERALSLQRPATSLSGRATRAIWAVFVQVAVVAAWVFFRSTSIESATAILGNIATSAWEAPAPWMPVATLFLAPVVVLHLWRWCVERGVVLPLGPAPRAALAAAMAYGLFAFAGGTSDFIYFQF